jgi:outer membrane protein OmpA-like peptidoglycan-associated protein
MNRRSVSDALAYPFTDLMTSLMVIFILVLLVFLNNQASLKTAVTRSRLADLKRELEAAGFKNIGIEQRDPYTIVVPLAGQRLLFKPNEFELQPQGHVFLQEEIPKLAKVLCESKYRASVDTVIVEGHSDAMRYHGASLEESQIRNLKLSQNRALEVVSETLALLSNSPAERGCLFEKLTASGRGEQDLALTADTSRRAVLKIRVNATPVPALDKQIGSYVLSSPVLPPQTPNVAATKVLDVIHRLNAVPRQQVTFQLSESELNEYLAFSLKALLPRPGIESVRVKLFPHNYVTTVIVIDFDLIQRTKPGVIPEVFRPLLKGRKSIWIDFRFQIVNERATFSVEKAYYEKNKLPSSLVRRIIQVMAALQPEHYDTESPILLPFGLHWANTSERQIAGGN